MQRVRHDIHSLSSRDLIGQQPLMRATSRSESSSVWRQSDTHQSPRERSSDYNSDRQPCHVAPSTPSSPDTRTRIRIRSLRVRAPLDSVDGFSPWRLVQRFKLDGGETSGAEGPAFVLRHRTSNLIEHTTDGAPTNPTSPREKADTPTSDPALIGQLIVDPSLPKPPACDSVYLHVSSDWRFLPSLVSMNFSSTN
ncbi:hypothetical protein EYF80_050624 [Liparis tanakae]|uniref:Uncharacterized protein n=1 Tax=Liparis tanakae TaxID=230148 RepID=A0A4Z2FEA2_9TELE|nr:hypothetical protein EYF80_050624 [Liparis tanakae]